MSRAYYNEIDRDAAYVLRCLIADGLIAPGDVDDRSIKDVQPHELVGYTQCHFFAGAGLWSVAARIAGWPDDRALWTGSCPCQPFSAAGRGLGADDPRHLWPDFFRLIRASRPPVVMGEQVAGAPGYGWFDGVRADLAGEDFASRVVDIPVRAVDGPHIRQRLWWCSVDDAQRNGWNARRADYTSHDRDVSGSADRFAACAMADTDSARQAPLGRNVAEVGSLPASQRRAEYDTAISRGSDAAVERDLVNASRLGRREGRPEPELRGGRSAAAVSDVPVGLVANAGGQRRSQALGSAGDGPAPYGEGAADRDERVHIPNRSFWTGADWLLCHDGKARRTEPGIRLLVDGMAGRVPAWRLAGNSISPVLAAEVIRAFLDAEDEGYRDAA